MFVFAYDRILKGDFFVYKYMYIYIYIYIYISGPVGKEVRRGTPAPPAGCRGPVC